MGLDLAARRKLVDEMLGRQLDRCRGQVPEHLLNVLEGYLSGGGKRVRPLLMMLCCEGLGGSAEDIVPAAAAVEMYHNWTLIHDDVIDHDARRRGRPTGHVIGSREGSETFGLGGTAAGDYGISVAILSGDLLHGLSLELLASLAPSYPKVIPALLQRMSGRLCRELIGGEQLDVELSHMPFERVGESLMQLMMNGKTGALFRFAMECGAALGLDSIEDERISAMGIFGSKFGLSFQLQDDLLGIFGSDQKLGKPVGSDIREGKRTLLAARTLQGLEGVRRARFLELYGKADVTSGDIAEVQELMRESGAAESVRKSAARILEQALQTLRGVMAPSEACLALESLTMDMLSREV